MARAFVVPAALDGSGRLVRPAEAVPGEHTCPGCGARVILRAGRVKVRHFAHGPGSCSGETALHAAARALLVQVIERGDRPAVVRTCEGCEREWREPAPVADTALPERRLPGGLRPDVLLLAAGAPVLVLEVLVHHAVDEAKAARLELPFLELSAQEVLDDPLAWRPVREGEPRSLCPSCTARRERDARELVRLCAELGLDPAGYPGWVAALDRCEVCRKETVRFTRGKGGGGPARGRSPPNVHIARVEVREKVGSRWVRSATSRTVTACFFCPRQPSTA